MALYKQHLSFTTSFILKKTRSVTKEHDKIGKPISETSNIDQQNRKDQENRSNQKITITVITQSRFQKKEYLNGFCSPISN